MDIPLGPKPTPVKPPPGSALLAMGFRPFFILASLFAVLSMAAWAWAFTAGRGLPNALGVLVHWHAHEMIFGYPLAVVGGFLLTAVRNWTGIQTLRGPGLGVLATLWLVARMALLAPGDTALAIAASADLLFLLGLILAVTLPVLRVKQWQQLGLLSLLWLILLGNGLFYAGASGHLQDGQRLGLMTGLYLLLALVLLMARRVLPSFIGNAVPETYSPPKRPWLDTAAPVLFLAWAVLDIFTGLATATALAALALFALHLLRLRDWHTRGLWARPLLWSLYLGYVGLVSGFLLKALASWGLATHSLALHAFTVGGIGLMSLGMMARVTLGHTGRNVFSPPRMVVPMAALLVAASLTRVLLPLVDTAHHLLWIGTSQALWILAFGLFCWVFIPQLIATRVDGKPG